MTQVRPKFVQARITYLTASITDAEVDEIVLDSFLDAYGNQLLPANFPGIIYFTIDPGLETEEIISCTSFTVNGDGTVSLDTNIVRGLAAISPYASGGTAESHAAGCVILCADNPQVLEQILAYVEDVAISGAPNASPTVKGITQIPTAAQINSGTNEGSTGAVLSISPDQLLLSIYNVQLPSATQKNALAGSAGTPGTGNEYITKQDVSDSGGSDLIVRLNGTQYPAGDGTQLTGIALARDGGTGADGALSITSGTTTLAVSSALYFVKNYTSISITGTGSLTLSGQPNAGTILVLKSQGGITLTSSATNLIDLTGLGAAAGASSGGNGKSPVSSFGYYPSAASGGGNGTGGTTTQGPVAGGIAGNADISTMIFVGKFIPLVCGGGGGGGGSANTGFGGNLYGGGGGGGGGTVVILTKTITANSGTISVAGGNGCADTSSNTAVMPGGPGGGALYIEGGGALNFTGNISVAGVHGGNGTGGGAGGNGITGGAGIGGAGSTQTNTAGSGGAGGSGAPNAANGSAGSGGGGGASGSYFVGINTIFT